jgi:hypothetical protein
LLASHHPTELLKPIDPDRIVENYRNLVCEHYDDCLDEAVTKHWTSWTCEQCPLFAHEPRVKAFGSCRAAAQPLSRSVWTG